VIISINRHLDKWSSKISTSHNAFPSNNKYRKLFWNNQMMLDIVGRYATARHIIYLCLAPSTWNTYSLLKPFASPDCGVSRTRWHNMLTNGNNRNCIMRDRSRVQVKIVFGNDYLYYNLAILLWNIKLFLYFWSIH